VNHIRNLPAISAQKDHSWEEYESDREHYQIFCKRTDVTDDEKQQMEKNLIWRSYNALGWEVRERALRKKAQDIADGLEVSPLIVERPEDVAQYIETRHIKTNESDYLLKRLRDCIAFPLTDSKSIRAKMDLASRRLLMMKGDANGAFAERNDARAAVDLYSLLQTYQAMSDMSQAEIFGLLRSDVLEMANKSISLSKKKKTEIASLKQIELKDE